MDKYEFNIKVEQIKKLVGKSDYETAMKIADTIDWRRVRNTNLLSMVAMVYEKNEDYEEAREILLLAFERAPIGKRLLYKLAELALKEGNIDEAEAYYREFCDLAGDDPRQQLLRYLILKAKGAPAQQLIHSLESYTSQEIDEKWLYELAELYSLAGMTAQCVETCDKIMLMFGLGQYVEQAMDLKTQYAPLSSYQMDLVENRDKYEAKLRAVEQEYGLGGNRNSENVQEEEYYGGPDNIQNMPEQQGYYEEEITARMEEAAVQENLAREMSRFTYQEPAPQPVTRLERTRVLDDIRRVGHPAGRNMGYGEEEAAAGYAEPVSYGTAGYSPEYEDGQPEEYGSVEVGVVEDDPEYGYSAGLTGTSRMAGTPGRMAAAMPRPHGVMYMPVEDEYTDYGNQPEAGYEEEQYGENAAEPYTEEVYPDEEYEGKPYLNDQDSAGDYPEEPYVRDEAADYINDVPAGDGSANIPVNDAPTAEASETVPLSATEQPEDEWPGIEDIDGEDAEDEAPILNHLMIEARTPEKGLQTAVEALKQIHKETGSKNPVARITGSKLSRRGVMASAEKLAGKDLVIEEAGDLTDEALTELNELMTRDTSGMIVVLIDNPRQMEQLHREHPSLASKFECIGSGEAAPAPVPKAEEPKNRAAVRPLYPEKRQSEAPVKRAPEEPYGEESYGEEPYSEKTYSEKPYSEKTYGEKPYSEEPYSEESYEKSAYEDNPYEEAAYGEESYEEEPEEAPTAKKEKSGGFWKRKKPVYEELEPEESYEDGDYYEEEPDDGYSVRNEEGPGSHGEEMDIDEFAQYACRYANEIDCSITGKSMLALYERIEIMEEDSIPLTRENAEALIEEAADRAEKPSFGKRIKGIFSSKYDKDGLLILKEEHFIY